MRFRFTFTVRRLMVVIAVAALTIAGARWAVDTTARRAAVLRRRSSDHEHRARFHEFLGKARATQAKFSRDGERKRQLQEEARWHREQERLSKGKALLAGRAATRPWLRMDEEAYSRTYPRVPLPTTPAPSAPAPVKPAPADDDYKLEWPLRDHAIPITPKKSPAFKVLDRTADIPVSRQVCRSTEVS